VDRSDSSSCPLTGFAVNDVELAVSCAGQETCVHHRHRKPESENVCR